jgi:hypothetical protein
MLGRRVSIEAKHEYGFGCHCEYPKESQRLVAHSAIVNASNGQSAEDLVSADLFANVTTTFSLRRLQAPFFQAAHSPHPFRRNS